MMKATSGPEATRKPCNTAGSEHGVVGSLPKKPIPETKEIYAGRGMIIETLVQQPKLTLSLHVCTNSRPLGPSGSDLQT